MVDFVTLFLSLVVGLHTVEVAVQAPVAAVEIILDGRTVAVLRDDPWQVECDFGAELAPHELLAVGLDGDGHEVSRVRQLINVPRPRSEARFVLERDESGRARVARLISHAVGSSAPESVRITFDGEPVVAGDLERIVLPAYDPGASHLLSARLEFADGTGSRTDVIVGGGSGGEVRTELTAVPVLATETDQAPLRGRIQGWFLLGDEPLSVAAVEKPGSVVFVVGDPQARAKLLELAAELARLAPTTHRSQLTPEDLGPQDDRLHVVVPMARLEQQAEVPLALFPVSRSYRLERGGLPWMVTHLVGPELRQHRLADAVALAAVRAATGACPRAVVVVVDRAEMDVSGQSPNAVRSYLGTLRVPLRVWTVGDPGRVAAGWGEAVDVSSRKKLGRAAKELEEFLERQWIVWVRGQHMPSAVTLSPDAEGIQLLE